MEEFIGAFCDLVRQIFVFGPPVVAALPGHAIAGGLIAAMAADERIAAEGKGKFGLSEVILGVSVPACLMEPFRHVVGARHMERLAATGENLARRAGARDRPRRPRRPGRRAPRPRRRAGAFSRRAFGRRLRGDQAALARGGDRALRPGPRPRPLPRLLVQRGRALSPEGDGGAPRRAGDPGRRDPRGPRSVPGRAGRRAFSRPSSRASTRRCPSRTPRRSSATPRLPTPNARPRTPDVFWRDHLALGTGGTCFARVAAFEALLTALGFRSRRLLGRVQRDDDHAALLVETAAGQSIVDVGFPLPAILPARAGAAATAQGELAVAETPSRIPDRVHRGRSRGAARDRDFRGRGLRRAVRRALARHVPCRERNFCARCACAAISATGSSRLQAGSCGSTICTRAFGSRLSRPPKRRSPSSSASTRASSSAPSPRSAGPPRRSKRRR